MFRLTLAGPACIATPLLADRILAEATCSPTDIGLRFSCEITLSEGGMPVTGAAFTVKPDMPSMPMAHNNSPVPAEAAERPGIYTAPLELQMPGEWILTLDLTAPRRDRVVLRHDFGDAAPEDRSMGHSSHAISD